MRILPALVAIAVAGLIAVSAQSLTPPPPEGVGKLAWMAGEWLQVKDGSLVQEAWLLPTGGTTSGVGQTYAKGGKVSVEFMTITNDRAGVTFTAMLRGQPSTPFVLLADSPDEAVFENKAHDFPQRVIYRRCGAELCGRIEGTIGGKLKFEEWRYTRVKRSPSL